MITLLPNTEYESHRSFYESLFTDLPEDQLSQLRSSHSLFAYSVLEADSPDSRGCLAHRSGSPTKFGYKRVTHYDPILDDKVKSYAHRFAYALINDLSVLDIEGLCIGHYCNTRPCIRPEHLHSVSHIDNTNEKHVHAVLGITSRSTHELSRLTDNELRLIIDRRRSKLNLSRELSVSTSLISRVRRGSSYLEELQALSLR